MGIDVEATCTPRVEQKAVTAGNKSNSYGEASEHLQDMADITLGEKRLARIIERAGKERVSQRECQLEDYEKLPIPMQKAVPPDAPEILWEKRVAAVFLDGGRAQLRDARWGQKRQPGEKKHRWWRESKVALVATLASQESQCDPIPEVPESLLDPLWLVPKLNEIKAAKGGEGAAEQVEETTSPDDKQADAKADKSHDRWSPAPVVRSVVATFESYDHLGRLVKTEAYHRGFAGASRKAFVGDGLSHNWSVHQKYFSDYTPITDLMHALSYVYQAAKHTTCDMEACWQLCKQWITLTWQGDVGTVIEEIDQRIKATKDPEALEKLHSSRRYLANNQDRMRYAEFRARGLPITTALMESTVKRINRRIKGTEKFWGPTAEPQLQLCADALSETDRLDKYWQHRADTRPGRRKSRTTR